MAFSFLSAEDVTERIIGEWQASGIINTEDASVLSLIMYPFQIRITDLYATLFDIHQSHRISSAFGIDLDEIARGFGVIRKTSIPAADYTYGNFRFYLPNEITAKDYTIDRTGFEIPAGQNVSDGVTNFITLDAAVFDADSHSAFVRIQGTDASALYIPENAITEHQVTPVIISEMDPNIEVTILCTNNQPIELESTLEDDNSLRDRLYDRVNSNGTNDSAITFALKTLGILDAEYVTDAFGVGTLGVRLVTGEPIISDTTLDAADGVIRSITPYARVIRSEYLVIKIQLQLDVDDESIIESTKSDVMIVIKDYIDAIPSGSQLNITTLDETIDNVPNVTRHNTRCLFLNERRCVLSSQRSASDQKFIISREDDAVMFVS